MLYVSCSLSKVQFLMTVCSLGGCVGRMRYEKAPAKMSMMFLEYVPVRRALNVRLESLSFAP